MRLERVETDESKLILNGKRMVLSGSFNPGNQPKFIETHWNHDKGHASLPLCGDIYRRVMGMNLGALYVDPDILDHLRAISKTQKEILNIAEKEDSPGDPRLYPHQRVGVLWLSAVKRGILADDQGIGKTVQSLTAAEEQNPRLVLVVCGHSKMGDWAEEVEEWTSLVPLLLEGDKDARESILEYAGSCAEPTVLIIGHKQLIMHQHTLAAIGPDVMIYDEAHNLRNREVHGFRAAKKSARSAEHLYLLTASPSVNEPTDVWTLLHLIDPRRFSSYWSLVFRFCRWREEEFGFKVEGIHPSEEETFARMMNVYMLRREKGVHVHGLPRRRHRKRMLTMKDDHTEVYAAEENDLMTVDGEVIEVETPKDLLLAKITRLRQIATEPRVLISGYNGNSKRDAVLEEVHQGTTSLVFSRFARIVRSMSEWLNENGIISEILIGDVPPGKRKDIVDRFQSGEIDVLCMTYGTGGEGLTLTRASKIVFCDLEWHPAGMRQAQERVHRYGQEADVIEIVTLLMSGTIDEYMWDIIRRKRQMSVQEIISRIREGSANRG